MRVALHTIGCKLNQYETEVIREGFIAAGHDIVPFDTQADLYLVNTCTVTQKADHDARRLLRQAKRRNPSALVVAAGCYAQTDAGHLAAMPEVDLVLGNADKLRLSDWLSGARPEPGVRVTDLSRQTCFEPVSVRTFASHTRAFVKIQDGCDARCAYCKVPLARGPNRSRPLDDTIAQIRQLCASGHREVVLIGIHLGTYGRDLTPPASLAELLRALLDGAQPERLRLSSIEPLEFSPELIDILATHAGRICRHLHIPLQSGSDRVLAAMDRRYTAEEYASIVGELARRIPGLAIGADVLVGLPGETDDDHARTRELVQTLPLAYLHVFSYSPREGTLAASLPGPVRPDLIKTRSRELLAISSYKHTSYLGSLVGTEQSVLFEHQVGDQVVGHTDTYAEVAVPAGEAQRNDLARVRVDGAADGRCFGHVIGTVPVPRPAPGPPPDPSAL